MSRLPIARRIVEAYVGESSKLPWYIDLLNVCLNVQDSDDAAQRIQRYIEAFEQITASAFEPDLEDPMPRIQRNLGLG